MSLSNVLQRLARPRRELSVFAVLERLVGAQHFQRIASLTPDRRELCSEIARQLNLPEDFLLERLAQELAVPFVRIVPEFSPSILEGKFELCELERLGCAPLVDSTGLVRCIACIDPLLARALAPAFENVSVVLATWSQIQKAILHAQAASRQEAVGGNEKQLDIGLRVVAAIIEEIEESDGRCCTVSAQGDRLEYEFELPDGRHGRGYVHAGVCEQVRAFLMRTHRGDNGLRRIDGSSILFESVRVELQRFSVRFSWAKELPRIPATSQTLPSSESNVIQFPNSLAATSSMEATALIRRNKALVIEDNKNFGQVLERFLARYELDVLRVERAEEALAIIEAGSESIDLLLCDVHLPGMKGGDFLRTLRSKASLADLPIIMLTSDSDVETELGLLRDGADVFLNKNEDPRLLGVHIQRFLARIKKSQAA